MDSVALKGASFQVFRSPCRLSPIIIVLVTQNIMILIILNVGFLHDHGGLNAEGLKAITDLFLRLRSLLVFILSLFVVGENTWFI